METSDQDTKELNPPSKIPASSTSATIQTTAHSGQHEQTHHYEPIPPKINDDTVIPTPKQTAKSVGAAGARASSADPTRKPHIPLHRSATTSSVPSSSSSSINKPVPNNQHHPQQPSHNQPQSSSAPQRPTLTSRWNSISHSLGIGVGATHTDNHNRPAENTQEQVIRSLTWFGKKVYDAIETVGEGVVSVLGLDDSHFQDVLDGMTEEEMEVAERINREREEEYMIYKAKKDNEATHAVDVESASATTGDPTNSGNTADPASVVLSI